MKTQIPAANALIGTIYLLMIIALGYVIKLIFKPNPTYSPTPPKYTSANIQKGLFNPLMQNNIQPNRTLVQAYLTKYSLLGTIININRSYLLKQIFIISVVFVSCTSINRITLWPLALCFAFLLVSLIFMEILRVPFLWNISPKIDEQKKVNSMLNAEQQLEIEPGLIATEPNDPQKVKQDPITNSHRYTACLGTICFVSLVLITQTMMSIFNSISNLGALNIGSVVCVVLIDQVAIRPACFAILLGAFKFISWKTTENLQHTGSNQLHAQNSLKTFQLELFRNLCEQILLKRMNEIYNEHGESSNYEMGASPTKKKTNSPSKIPKANPPAPESDTLMNLEETKRKGQFQHEQHVDERSPIKQIEMGNLKESFWLTSAEKEIFTQQIENQHSEINKFMDPKSAQKIKINPNQYFSVQRLPKDELHHEEHLEDDGLVLVEAGLNLVKQQELKLKPNTIDIEFSPTKKRKKTMGAHQKRRQLIITGNSPYLEYLPDMMKKQRLNKKNLTPSSHKQIPTISRKVL